LRAISDASAQAIAGNFGDQSRLAIDHLQGTFGATDGANTATVTLFLIDPNNLTFHTFSPAP